MLGISQRRAAGKTLDQLYPWMNELAELVTRAGTSGHGFSHELSFPNAPGAGEALEISARVTPLLDSDEQLMLELVDSTHRHHFDRENALIAQHGVSRRMLRQLAHEIRNPLGGLRGAAQLLEKQLGKPELREFTQIIIGEADRLAGLMDSLLGPGQQPRKVLLNVHEILEHVATLIQSENKAELTVVKDYDPSLPPVAVDKDQMIQAVLNLARNAVQAMQGTGELILRTRVITNMILGHQLHRLVASIEIEDNGPGVPDDIQETLFYPLVSGRNDGTGLGLPLAQDLVSRHDGLIEYHSRPGQTVFMLRLPINAELSAADQARAYAGSTT